MSTFRTFALVNQKGGVGKTTTAINLGTALAAMGKTALVIDLDPQGNASTGLGIERAQRENGTYDVLMGAVPAADAIVTTSIPRLSIIPSTVDLAGAEIELVNSERREHRLKEALAAIAGRFDYILIDCPPSLNLLTLNALVVADALLVPLQTEFYALEGLSYLVQTVERVKRAFNDKLELAGIILTMFDRRNSLSEQVAQDVRGHFAATVFETIIPRNVRVSEAPSYGLPVLIYDHRCVGAQAYIQLAAEFLRRFEGKRGNG
ncbi:MAG TPA: ParA family protein [Alphaproteobacteria bacterium]|jgi:chromosome partitioning protein|nr:ParA family protein [Alphaproteobacteria bacterium]